MRYAFVIAFAVGLALLGSAATGAGEARGKATLKLTKGAPLTIRGSHFVPRERVRLRVTSGDQATRRVTANGTGGFVAQFQLDFDRCNGLLVRAIGSEGSDAALKSPELMCPPRL
jgi:hypothetical protein